MMDSSAPPALLGSSLPLPANAPREESTSSSSMAALGHLMASFKTSSSLLVSLNPFPGITSLKGFLLLLRKETPRLLDFRAYSRPPNSAEAVVRIRSNAKFFRATYSIVFFVVLILFVLSNPTVFVSCVLLGAMWSAFLQNSESVWHVGSVELKRNEKLVILVSLSVILMFFSGLISSLVYVVFSSGIIVAGHGAFRDPVTLDALEVLQEEGESIVKGEKVLV